LGIGTALAFSFSLPSKGAMSELNLQGDNSDAERTKGFLTYRIADRGCDHFDHRGDRNSEFDAFENGCE
jgi:hypothetical protein